MVQGSKIAREIRESLGVTKYKMAQRLGITPQSYEILESKSVNMHVRHLLALWDIARVDLDWSAVQFLVALQRQSSELTGRN